MSVAAGPVPPTAVVRPPREHISRWPLVDRLFCAPGNAGIADEAECISDVRGSAAYKRELTRVYVARAVRQALDGNGATH